MNMDDLLRQVDELVLCDALRPTGIEKHFSEPEPRPHPCTACGCPTVNNQYCLTCIEMFAAVAGRRWFTDAHAEWTREQERKRAMITGDGYFPA